ncbi:uncharacterized protein NEMAJ01_1318 [Nematocida major]|uniref:uncharacterized protein n=1 Tax=Nematocida major TaxID=1912982 RepID=UPI0020072063|nr:uncharacterized protein NEMAJ01_1318 [Nematocida major]KAH9386422.1 hypothetical protein NEMAJ01_1318 [Nematocida major]
MESSGENSKTKAVAMKVKETDEKAHQQVKKIKESRIGKLIPTECGEINTKKMVLIALIVNATLCTYTYLLFIALFGKTQADSFVSSPIGIILGITYILAQGHDTYVYFLDKSTMLLSFLGVHAVGLAITVLTLFFLDGNAATLLFKFVIVSTYSMWSLVYVYLFSIHISHIKMGGSSSTGDHQEV